MAKVYFTSDPHFDHRNIIKYCERPFKDVDEMCQSLIHEWNGVVGGKDTVYLLGDVFMGNNRNLINEVLSQLNGDIILIEGNHDSNQTKQNDRFSEVTSYKEVSINGKKVVLFHYPIEEWNGKFKGSFHFHGHSHGNAKFMRNRFDVGVDSLDYKPASFEEITELFTSPIGDNGDQFEINDFIDNVKDGFLTDYDGYGYYIKGDKVNNLEVVFPSGLYYEETTPHPEATGVLWFNK
jgi:calcineurin-like phosphoesterase family protein